MFECVECNKNCKDIYELSKHWGRMHKRSPEDLYKTLNKIPLGQNNLCACGCGSSTKFLNVVVGYRKYNLGHSSRIKNNWGHNKKATQKSLAKRREMLKDGTWKPFTVNETGHNWIKGLTVETDQRVAKMQQTVLSSLKLIESKSKRMSENRKNGTVPSLYGPKHPNWKGGISSLTDTCYSNTRFYKEWKYPKLLATNFTCEGCNKNYYNSLDFVKLQIHHDKEKFSDIVRKIAIKHNWEHNFTVAVFNNTPEIQALKLEISEAVVDYHIKNNVSGKVLCRDCHKLEHDSYNFYDTHNE